MRERAKRASDQNHHVFSFLTSNIQSLSVNRPSHYSEVFNHRYHLQEVQVQSSKFKLSLFSHCQMNYFHWHKFTFFLKSWDVQHDIIVFNSYLSYWSHCYICKFNAVCFSYYLDDSQATNWTDINVENICVCERAERVIFEHFRIYVLPLRSPTKLPFLSMFDLICKIWHVCLLLTTSAHSVQFLFYILLMTWHYINA